MVSKTIGRVPKTSLSICPKPRSLLEHRLLSGTCGATCMWQSIRGLVSRRPCSSVLLPVLDTNLCPMGNPCEQVTWNADTSRSLFAGGVCSTQMLSDSYMPKTEQQKLVLKSLHCVLQRDETREYRRSGKDRRVHYKNPNTVMLRHRCNPYCATINVRSLCNHRA